MNTVKIDFTHKKRNIDFIHKKQNIDYGMRI